MSARRDTTSKAAPPPPAMPKAMSKSTWKLLDRAATIGAAVLAQRASVVTWRGLTGAKPPASGRHPEVSTTDAVLWAAIVGGLTELIRTGVHRGVASYWVRSTGQLPPGMKTLTPPPPVPDEIIEPSDDAVKVAKKRAKKERKKREKKG